MKRSTIVLAFLSSFFISTGFVFKIMHWPAAGILMITGFVILNFGFLPSYFFERYRTAK